MGNFQLPRPQLIDSSGDVVSGGTIEFYNAGTTTPLTVYSDEDLTSAIGTTVTTDASGRIENVWIDDETAFKVIVKDASGNTVYTDDDLYAYGTSGGAGFNYMDKIASHPLRYGAIGDGAADERSEVQEAIDNATGTVDLLGLTFRCDAALTIPSNIRLINGTLDFSNYSSTSAMVWVNSTGALGSALTLVSNCDLGDTTVTLTSEDGDTLAAGDWVQLSSTDDWSGTENATEVLQVISEAAGVVTFSSPTRGSYTTANAASLKKMPMVERFTASEVKIIGGGAVANQVAFQVDYVVNPVIENCHFEDCEIAIDFEDCVNATARNNVIENGPAGSQGINVSGCLGANIDGNQMTSELATSATYGVIVNASPGDVVSRGIRIGDNRIVGYSPGIWLDAECEDVTTSGNYIICSTADADSNGIYDESCSGNAHLSNTIIMSQGESIHCIPKREIQYSTPAGGDPASMTERLALRIENNCIRLSADYGIRLEDDANGHGQFCGVSIRGNNITGLDGVEFCISIEANSNDFHNIHICDNSIVECSSAIQLITTSTGDIFNGVISNNTMEKAALTGTGIYMIGASGNDIRGFTISGNTFWRFANAIHAKNASWVSITGNKMRACGNNAFFYEAVGNCESVSFDNNLCDAIVDEAIQMTVATGITLHQFSICNNLINDSGDDSIEIICTGSGVAAYGTVSNNVIHNSTDHAIHLDGAQAGGITMVTVADNIIHSPTHAIDIDYGDYVTVSGNVFSGSASSPAKWIEISDTTQCHVTGNLMNAGGGASGIAIDINNTANAKTVDGITVSGNTIRSFDGDGIVISQNASGNMTGVKVQNNSIDGAGDLTRGIVVDVDNGNCDYLVVSGNTINASSGYGIEVDCNASGDLDMCSFVGNIITSSALYCIYLHDSGSGTADRVTFFSNTLEALDNTAASFGINIANTTITNALCHDNMVNHGTFAGSGASNGATSNQDNVAF